MSLLYRAVQIVKDSRKKNYNLVYEYMLSRMFVKVNFIHQMIRTANLTISIWLIILIGNYASKANMNQGILYSLVSLAIVLNIIICYFLFNEKIAIKTYLGIVTLICGVIWMSIAKNKDSNDSVDLDSDEIYYNKMMAISLAILSSFIYVLRPVQAKWVH